MQPLAALPENKLSEKSRAAAATADPGLEELDRPGFVAWASDRWRIPFKTGQDHCLIHGSPERAMSRGVISDIGGRRFLVEKFSSMVFPGKQHIAQTLDRLRQSGLTAVLVPESTVEGAFLAEADGAFFQVTRFVEGTDLPRPGWLASGERGRAMADFLAAMGRRTRAWEDRFPFFSIKAYIYRLFEDMAAHSPDRHAQYLPVLRFLEKGFMDAHDGLPRAFCHGDFHPVNIIWKEARVRAVIDWEFCGVKPDLYDAANLLGCAGIEHPEGLVMPMAAGFLEKLAKEDLISPLGWRWLPEYVLALRFAWLSEWLRKADLEMLDTEYRFMEILMDNMPDLREIWAGTRI